MSNPMAILNDELARWNIEVEAALQKSENQIRHEQHKDPMEWNVVNVHHSLHTLNWKIWSTRYNVSTEFILTFILRRYAAQRKRPKPSLKNRFTLEFGLPIAGVTGAACRESLEEYLRHLYPNGENLKDCEEPPPLGPLHIKDYSNPDEVMERYGKAMRKRHHNAITVEKLPAGRFSKVR